MDDVCNLDPDELAFFVIIRAAPPIPPARAIQQAGHGDGGIEDRPPGTSGTARAKARGDSGDVLVIIIGRPHPTARREDVAEIGSVALVDPEKIGFHGRLKIGYAFALGTAEFAAPRVR